MNESMAVSVSVLDEDDCNKVHIPGGTVWDGYLWPLVQPPAGHSGQQPDFALKLF